MVVKIPLMTLFHALYLLITGDPWIESASDALSKLILGEALFFIPLYLIYLPLFIYNIKTQRIEPRFMYWDMSMICLIVCPLAFGISLNDSLWFALGTAVFVATYLMLTAIVHLYFCWPYIFGDGHRLPRNMDKTLPEYAAWQEKMEALKKERQEKYALIHVKKQQKTREKKTRNKIGYIFFFTGIIANFFVNFILYYAIMYVIMYYTCITDFRFECSRDLTFEIFSHLGTEDHLLMAILATFFVYTAVYVLYFPITHLLWKRNLRTFAHFALGMCPIILLSFINLFFFQQTRITSEGQILSFYAISASLILTSVIHLFILKLYDKYIGIPEQPPCPKRWYDRFFSRKPAKA